MEQVDALLRAAEEQLDKMPRLQRVVVMFRCGTVNGDAKWMSFKSKLGLRLERRAIQMEFHPTF